MIHHLENENIKIAVDSKGAELKSVFNKPNQEELLWQADPEFWGKSSPVLFPIVGTLKNGIYIYDKKKYKLPRHGFARDYNFKLQEFSDSQLIFSLESSKETIEVYPFLFRLEIIYTLKDNTLQVEYKVKNLSDVETMYFSVGAHPAFKVGSNADDFFDYSLLFNKDNEFKATCLKDGLLTTDKNTITLTNQKIQLNYELFENDALVLLDMKSDKVTLLNNTDKNILSFEFENFPYFGIWTMKDSGFICLEPWAGVADFDSHDQQLENKTGINTLKPKESWSASWSISIS
ncbi:aldose 1-epimerase family protein [Paenimyroides baculatum]|uniref:Aldose 1-epimerase family protein n=1 Tax=Paenimyroides baculatum TaxID=2608000 RepID=A0A5M6CJS7_9FLAO|nr:aldose 1-epimerase family protein [Paenimyroides baculatum]KAA5535374.1 aldose 1-epimerase family protein [Paenimyroides baculatum]